MTGSKFCACALLAILGLTALPLLTARAQEQGQGDVIIPYPGETAAEFEARKRGLPRPVRPDATTVVLIADPRGHFGVEPTINGTRIHMVVDTGATSVVLSEKDAHSIGIDPAAGDFKVKVATANGFVLVAPTLLSEVAVHGIVLRDVPAVVVPENRLQVSLLGMSFLSRLTRFEVSGGKLVLTR
jgi:aspartyl protease family protein